MYLDGTNGILPIGDGLLEVTEATLKNLIVQGDINEFYDVEQTPFARGKFATVRRAMHKKTGVSFAAKFLRRRRRAQCTLKEIRHEIAILLLCADSGHIVKLHSVHETTLETALLLELATGGELQTLLDEAGSLTEPQTRICMQEVLKALQYLHKKSIAHLDLKPQNILLCGTRVEDGLKLCDFGISRVVAEGGSKVREILGTPDYVAPEVLSYEPLSLKTDIWSVGVLAYVLLSGFSPFGGDTKQETFLNISQCNLSFPDEDFENISLDATDFIKCVLQVKADDRMTAYECLEHKWLMEFIEKNSLQNGSNTSTTEAGDVHMQPQNHAEKKTPPLPPKPSFLRRSSIKPINFDSNGTSSSSPITIHNSNASDIIGDQALNACTKNDCLKSNNNSSTTTALLEDYTNKENINLSKILANRTPIVTTTNAKGISLNNLTSNNTNSTSKCSNLEYGDDAPAPTTNADVAIMSATNSIPTSTSATPTTKYEQCSLFPDAPTTPKVCRKSITDATTPASVALVKQFQMSHKAAANEFVCINGDSVADSMTYTTSTKYILSTLRAGADELIVSSGGGSGGASSSVNHITTADTYLYRTTVNQSPTSKSHLQQLQYPNAHHHLHHITRSTNSSALTSATNSVTDLLSSPSSTTSSRCICDKTAQASSSCCCSTTTLYRRDKSIAVVDNSILC